MTDHDTGDRRLETRVRDAELKLHTLEISDAQHKLEIARLTGEISGLRSSSATSDQVRSVSDILELRLDTMAKDVASIKTVGWWFIGLIVAGFIAAIGTQVYK